MLSVDQPISAMGDAPELEFNDAPAVNNAPGEGRGWDRRKVLAMMSLVVLACVVGAVVAATLSNRSSSSDGTHPDRLTVAMVGEGSMPAAYSSYDLRNAKSLYQYQQTWNARRGGARLEVATLMGVPGVGSAEQFLDNECQRDETGGLKCGIANPLAAPTGAAQLLFYRHAKTGEHQLLLSLKDTNATAATSCSAVAVFEGVKKPPSSTRSTAPKRPPLAPFTALP